MTYGSIVECLKDARIENAETEASLLLAHFFGASPATILSSPEREYESDALLAAIDRRCEHYPLQYIFGEWDFFEETYFVNESCLIPRSDTECLVEQAISLLPKNAHFADLCTGSGCIAISTLAHREDCTALAIDLFEETLALAKRNAERNGVSPRLELRIADVLSPSVSLGDGKFDAILSNPPYIRTAIIDTLEDELFIEPRAALDGGIDGLVFYRAILENHAKHLKKNGFILFEIGFDQKEDIKALSSLYGYLCEVKNDLSGNPRTALLWKK
ncbi:MAG: peptide chain release factor N(5)-glutamine methyltransferase [Clostridia bacterium]|nr:peptide chain release factor N(5)-glutamine methyltransferase [Clostridia bacterium]